MVEFAAKPHFPFRQFSIRLGGSLRLGSTTLRVSSFFPASLREPKSKTGPIPEAKDLT
jgi:hypothetical protein